jgi:predicted DNA binding protein
LVLDRRPGVRAGEVLNWILVAGEGKRLKDLSAGIKAHPDVLMADLEEGRRGVTGVVRCLRCPLQAATAGLPCTVESHAVSPDRSAEITIMSSGSSTLRRLISRLENVYVTARVRRITRRHSSALTPRQEQVTRAAFTSGYFDYPRRLRQRELGLICGLSSSSLAETLRRAERNIIREHLRRVGPPELARD